MVTQDSHCASLSHECMSVLSVSSSSFPVAQGSLGRFWKRPREPAKGPWNCCEPARVPPQTWRAGRSGEGPDWNAQGKEGPVTKWPREPQATQSRSGALRSPTRHGSYTQTNGPSGSGLTGSRSQNHLDRKMGLRASMIPSSLGQDQRLSNIMLRIREVAH